MSEQIYLRRYEHVGQKEGHWTDEIFVANESLAGRPDLFPVEKHVAMACERRFNEQQKREAADRRAKADAETSEKTKQAIAQLAAEKVAPPGANEPPAEPKPTKPEATGDGLDSLSMKKLIEVIREEGLDAAGVPNVERLTTVEVRALIREARAKLKVPPKDVLV